MLAVDRPVPVVALWPTIRTVARTPVPGLVALALVPLVVTVVRGGTELGTAVLAGTVLGSASLGCALDDAAGVTLGASPTSRAVRQLMRGSMIGGLLLFALGGAVILTAAYDVSLGPLPDRIPEAAAIAGLAVVIAGFLAATGEGMVGVPAAIAATLIGLTSTVLAFRFDQVPRLGEPADRSTWWIVAAVAWALALWVDRDPASRITGRRRAGPPTNAPLPAP